MYIDIFVILFHGWMFNCLIATKMYISLINI